MDTKYNKIKEKLIWYLDECIINVSLHTSAIDDIFDQQEKLLKQKENFINSMQVNKLREEGKTGKVILDKDNLEALKVGVTIMNSEKQASIFSYTLLKSMVTSYFSIFEHYIYFVGKELNLGKEDESFEVYLNKKIWKSLGVGNLSELGNQEIFKRYREFYLRRNLYIHNYGYITEEYLNEIQKKQLMEVIPRYYDEIVHYKEGNILPIDGTYFMMNGNSLNIIGISITLFYVHQNFSKECLFDILQVIYNFLLHNEDYEVTYIMIFSLLENKLNLKEFVDFRLGYLIAIKKMSSKMNNKKSKKFEKKMMEKYIDNFNLEGFSIIQEIIYLWLNEDKNQVMKIIKEYIVENKNCNILSEMYSYDFLCDFIIDNITIFQKLYSQYGGEIKGDRSIRINHIQKIQKIQSSLIVI